MIHTVQEMDLITSVMIIMFTYNYIDIASSNQKCAKINTNGAEKHHKYIYTRVHACTQMDLIVKTSAARN